jgi:integrase
MVARACHYKPDMVEPEAYVIYQNGKELSGDGDTAIDNIVHAVAKRAGFTKPIGNHTLRRTCGRLMYYAGVPLEVIAEAFGHADIKQTGDTSV